MLASFGCAYLVRVGLHRLIPSLVHAMHFGRGYAEQALKTARAAFAR